MTTTTTSRLQHTPPQVISLVPIVGFTSTHSIPFRLLSFLVRIHIHSLDLAHLRMSLENRRKNRNKRKLKH